MFKIIFSFYSTVYRIVDIAVDALTRVLFYVDDIRLLIGMLTLTNDHDFIVLNTFQRPSAVTVDPQIGYVLYIYIYIYICVFVLSISRHCYFLYSAES